MTTFLHTHLKKRSLTISGHRTSIALETLFWDVLEKIAKSRNISLSQLIIEIDEQQHKNLTSALRVFALQEALSHSLE